MLYRALPENRAAPPDSFKPELPKPCEFLSRCVAYMNEESGLNETWLPVKIDKSLMDYLAAWLAYIEMRNEFGDDHDMTDVKALDLRVKYHMLISHQKKAVGRLGLYDEVAGAMPT